MIDGIAYVTVGVADLAPVTRLWVDQFGLEEVASRRGPDPDLARMWNIPADQIAAQLWLRTPGASAGWLQFVEFVTPDFPVRFDAGVTDLGPKNLDLICRDLPSRHKALAACGYSFRGGIGEYQVDDIHALELQMRGPDETNVVLVEVLSEGWEIDYSPAGFAALTSLVIVTADGLAEANFYQRVFGLKQIMHERIDGPGIEKAVGLPPGAALDMRLLGQHEQPFGRVEFIEYEQLAGFDRFPLARAPAVGALHAGFAVASLDAFIDTLDGNDGLVDIVECPNALIIGGRVAVLKSPAGSRIEVFERSLP